MELCCPICHGLLEASGRSLKCEAGHSFDVARQGYVNLLPVQHKHSLAPGDTREQVLSRRAFLESGAYAPIAEAVAQLAVKWAKGPVLDVGCGEGYYAARVAEALDAPLLGLDISKEAVRCAAAKYKSARWVCGTASRLPVPDESMGLVMSMFALTMPGEFARVLRPDGVFLRVLAARDHLLGLKRIIYPQVHLKQEQTTEVPGFRLVEQQEVSFEFLAEGEQVRNLLSMTPHFWRISREGAQRLEQTLQLRDRASCTIQVYAKCRENPND